MLYSGDTMLGSVRAGANGSWSLEITTDLTSGAHGVIARTETRESRPFGLNVETAADAPVTINSAYDNVGQTKNIYNNSSSPTDDTRPTFTGTAGAGQLVTLYSGENVLGSVRAGANGSWSLEITNELTSGRHTVIARTESRESGTFTFSVQTAADTPVTLTGAYDNVGEQRPIYNNSSTKTDDTRPTFSGTAGANQLVTLYSGEYVLGSVRAGTNGSWSLEITTELTSGHHTVIARTDSRESGTFTLNVEKPSDAPLMITRVLDNVGQQNYLVSGDGTTDDTRPTFSGTAGIGLLVTLYAGETVLGSVRANDNGNWSLEIPRELPEGRYDVVAKTDYAQSDVFTLEVDLTPPVNALYIDSILDNVSFSDVIKSGERSTDDRQPTFRGGGAQPNQLVTLYLGDLPLGSTYANASGYWSKEIDVILPNEQVSEIVAKTSDAQSEVFLVDVYSWWDVPLVLNSVSEQNGESNPVHNGMVTTDELRPTFSGAVGRFVTVKIFSEGQLLGSTSGDSEGRWSIAIDSDLAVGANKIVIMTASQQLPDIVINVESISSEPEMADILIDNTFSLFNEISQASNDEKLVLTLTDADMQYQSEGLLNQDVQNRTASPIHQEEQHYLGVM